MAGRWVSVNAAAEALDTSTDAIRKRIQRKTLVSDRQDGRVMVWLDDGGTGESEASGELVEELRDRVRYLERQLDQEREVRTEERRRHDTLMQQLMQRIPELEAPPAEPQGGQETHGEPGRVDTPAATSRPAEGGSGPLWHGADAAPEDTPRRPWWSRWFGG